MTSIIHEIMKWEETSAKLMRYCKETTARIIRGPAEGLDQELRNDKAGRKQLGLTIKALRTLAANFPKRRVKKVIMDAVKENDQSRVDRCIQELLDDAKENKDLTEKVNRFGVYLKKKSQIFRNI